MNISGNASGDAIRHVGLAFLSWNFQSNIGLMDRMLFSGFGEQ